MTVFEVPEAKKIIDTGIPMQTRTGDSHDVFGNYRLVADRNEMKLISLDENDFLDVRQSLHKILLPAHVDKNQGHIKERNNRAGNIFFADYKLDRCALVR